MSLRLAGFLSGSIFGAGLLISGMTRPDKVVGFLDITGRWDASLAVVMASALLVYGLLRRLVLRRPTPVCSAAFREPTRRDIDGRLIAGAALFGLGWGLAGYCPGPAIVSLSSSAEAVLFVAAMLSGMGLFQLVSRGRAPNRASSPVGGRS